MPKHDPLYHATYQGPQEVVNVGGRGYPAGHTVQVGKADADAIRKQGEHSFDVEQVPSLLIGSAQENQPTSPHKARQLHAKLLKHSHGIDVEVGEP